LAIGIATTARRGLPALPNLCSWEVSRSKWKEKAEHLLMTLQSGDAAACQKDAPAGVNVRPAWEWILDSE